MSKVIINSYQDFEQYVGKELGTSDYLKITQERINKFADATLDHQWIHTDQERAKIESPFHNTIAHGYNIKMLINYGIEKLKFNQPVIVDSEVRIRVKLESLMNLRGIAKAELKVIVEIKDSPKNALEETVIFLYHFNN
ncbi:MaoC family dehydratase [Dysgonomonas sp. 511]|uniref:MaoC family dehydratase n=1 Tax=Dysgonomonas sp. 511 TaxID=2302930 RepID=UPI0013D5C226|nr:MaoC family dehydratase [Dysgonomonas sp. 511]NDV79444.1 MaoC family dehydratase [Dysgonomonas sp. 511]